MRKTFLAVIIVCLVLVGCGEEEEHARQEVKPRYVEVIPPGEEHGTRFNFDNVITWDDPKGTITYWEDFD